VTITECILILIYFHRVICASIGKDLFTTALQDVHHLIALSIDEQRPRRVWAKSPAVNAKDPWRRRNWCSPATQQGERGGSTGR
jgi:hypothetical protein